MGEERTRMRLKVDGMTCGHCAQTVARALEEVPGVKSARVSLEKGEAEVSGDVAAAALVAAVEEEGYKARELAG